MKIRNVHIAGYGRFSDERIEFAPGVQVIIGPNEKGKSTIRAFVADMLYGQKCNETQRVYEESNALRAPWNGAETYGGSLTYVLDDGRSFEVVRDFDKNHESIQVFDRLKDEDVSGAFRRYRNRELDFAQQHLGLAKEVFLNTATISHLSLTDLGDSEALDRIREMMLGLTDSGRGAGTMEGALEALAQRISSIGRPDARNKPLPAARQRLAGLEAELRDVQALQATLRALAAARKSVLDDAAALQRDKQEAEKTLRILDHYKDVDRLAQAEDIQAQLDEVRRETIALSGSRDFPCENDDAVQAAHRALIAAEKQREKTRTQLNAIQIRMEAERAGSGPKSVPSPGEFPPDLERQIDEALAAKKQLAERVLEAHTLVNAAKERMEEVQQQLAEMPDFSRLAADPVEWLSQLASSFAVALRARDEECSLRDSIRKEVEALEDANTPHEGLFSRCADFSELAREYEVQARVHEEQVKRQSSELHSLQVTYDEAQGETQAFLPIGVVCLAVSGVLGGMYFFAGKAMWIQALVALAMGLIFIGMRSDRKGRLARLKESMAAAEVELARLGALKTDGKLDVIAELLRESGLDTVRELEARFDQYRSTLMELRIRREALDSQEEKASEAEERIPQYLARFKETFARAGEAIETEGDVQDAAGRAIARYQAYREAKRRATANRSVLERHEAELKRLEGLAAENESHLASLDASARCFIQDFGFPDSGQHASVKEYIAAYRKTLVESRELQGRHDLLAENLRATESQLNEETAELESLQATLEGFFAPHALSGLEEWNARVGAARDCQRLEKQAAALEDHFANLLGKQTTIQLRERVARFGDAPPRPQARRDELQAEITRLGEAVERKMREEHGLHEQLTQESVRLRPVAEVEEELALVRAAIRDLEAEVEAASYAMALMEDVARDKHAEIAPRLAEQASAFLATITRGNYDELIIGRDLSVKVRIPQTDRVSDTPEKSLSKGTVDQIYLALRLAFVRCISEKGESIPMLLDDPFANYDDDRLEAAMTLITESVGGSQVLLFTCREDVVSVAERLNASIIRL